jgi:quercetin dioxygenase-like cupin family protein
MDIKRSGSQSSGKRPAEWFTGTVRIDPLFQAPDPARVAGASVTFEPGARTAWHTHPLGQTLIVTGGAGLAQRWRGPIGEIRPGDVIWFPPGEKKEHALFGDDGFEKMVDRVASIEKSLGIYDLAQFTPK